MTLDQSELDIIRTAARRIADDFGPGYWREHEKKKAYPWEFVKAFAKDGWFGVTMPQDYGGMGLGLLEAGIILHEIAEAGGGASGASAFHYYVFPPGPVIHHGSEEMKKKYLPLLAAGEMMMCFGVTEPDNGVDTSR